jgi:hypothetical protein
MSARSCFAVLIQRLTVRALLAIVYGMGNRHDFRVAHENNAVVLAGEPPSRRTFELRPDKGPFGFVRIGPERTVYGTETRSVCTCGRTGPYASVRSLAGYRAVAFGRGDVRGSKRFVKHVH